MAQGDKLSIFLMATYGEGEPTDNAAKFVKWLKEEEEEVPEGALSSVRYSVFGLGNRQYEHYNRMGKLTDKQLAKFGAQRVFQYGEGDDDGTLEEDFEQWRAQLWPSLMQQFHPDSTKVVEEDSSSSKISLQFTVKTVDSSLAVSWSSHTQANNKINNSTKHFFSSPKVSFTTLQLSFVYRYD